MSSAIFHLLRPGVFIHKSYTQTTKFLGARLCLGASAFPKDRQHAALSTAVETQNTVAPVKRTHKLSKAMKAYQERAEAHDAFMTQEIANYEIGRRHLANIMGENPETFTDEDVDKSIGYLFPSGLFEPRARPHMKHPEEVFARRKAAEFDDTGRPFHFLFYTGLPNYYQVLHDITQQVHELNRFSSRLNRYSVARDAGETLDIASSEWISIDEFKEKVLEKIKDSHYDFLIKSLDRLVEHPYSYRAKDFIMKFRKEKGGVKKVEDVPKLMFTSEGVPYMTSSGRRKTALANVTVYARGSGKITINGQDILYFSNIQDREQIAFPLHFTGLLGLVDVEAEVEGGGTTGQSGAIRYALSMSLRSFVDMEMVDKMRLAGLLKRDPRRPERMKPGQKGARAKYTWNKR